MIALKSNRLLLWFIGLNAAYWSFGWFPAGVDFSAFFSGVLVVAGMMLASTVIPDAYQIIRRGDIGAGELAVVSIAAIATGLIYSGIFGLAWNFAGRPIEWVGPVSSYGRAMTGVGMFLMFLSPEATRHGIKPPRWWVLVIGTVLIALLAFLFGLNLGGENPTSAEFDTTLTPPDFSLLFSRRT